MRLSKNSGSHFKQIRSKGVYFRCLSRRPLHLLLLAGRHTKHTQKGGTQCTFHVGQTHTYEHHEHTHQLLELRGRHPLVGISVGSWGSLVVKADADTVRMRAAWKSKALINTDDSAPFHRALCVCVCVCVSVCGWVEE